MAGSQQPDAGGVPAKTPKKVVIYRFLPARYAIQAIEEKALRVGRLSELNDPFELIPAAPGQLYENRPDDDVHEAQRAILRIFDSEMGIISFSAAPHDPAVWSHYADSHRGIALGFEYELDETDRWLYEVDYPKDNERPTIHVAELLTDVSKDDGNRLLKKLMSTKALSWHYENEFRIFPPLSECQPRKGMYFQKILDGRLKVVLAGIRCPISDKYLRHALSASRVDADVARARLHKTSFRMDFDPPPLPLDLLVKQVE